MSKNNRFLFLVLLITLLFALLFISMNSVSQKQDLRSQAAKTAGCEQNIDCPTGTACVNGTCVLRAAPPSQSPLSYSKISEIDQEAKPIPSYFVEPTPTPQPHFLIRMSNAINGFVGGMINSILRLFDSGLQSVMRGWVE